MKIGLKATETEDIERYGHLFDYAEMFIHNNLDIPSLEKYKSKIAIIHAAHSRSAGFDLADPEKSQTNLNVINRAKKAAKKVGSKLIILHPGFYHGPESIEIMANLLEENYDERFVIENCIIRKPEHGLSYLCSTSEEMKDFLGRFESLGLKMGTVLDFSHAKLTANTLGLNPYKVIEEFKQLNPACYHVSGSSMYPTDDPHNHLDLKIDDLRYLSDIKGDACVTLEVHGKGVHSSMEEDYISDIEILRSIPARKVS